MLPPDVLEAQPSGRFCEPVKQLRTGQTHRQHVCLRFKVLKGGDVSAHSLAHPLRAVWHLRQWMARDLHSAPCAAALRAVSSVGPLPFSSFSAILHQVSLVTHSFFSSGVSSKELLWAVSWMACTEHVPAISIGTPRWSLLWSLILSCPRSLHWDDVWPKVFRIHLRHLVWNTFSFL